MKLGLYIKRIMDVGLAVVGLILLSPLFLILSLLILVRMGRPLLFRQERTGVKGKIFTIYKFRTMQKPVNDSINAEVETDELRITGLGNFLRKTSLDELPELWNVLRGEMSLVGPRPLLPEYLPLYNEEQNKRHNALPGMTGWAQINGRNALSWEDKFKLDVWYVENQSFWLDVKILLLTIIKVFHGDGVSKDGHVTTERFLGSNK